MKILMLLLTLLSIDAPSPSQTIDIGAKRFEFTPAVVHLKKGEPVTIRLTTTDRPHGLMVKALGIDLDAAEGQPDSVTITPGQAGTFDAICDHYCGMGHGGMKMKFVVE
jgi:cytochrome c oxidase subunit 2